MGRRPPPIVIIIPLGAMDTTGPLQEVCGVAATTNGTLDGVVGGILTRVADIGGCCLGLATSGLEGILVRRPGGRPDLNLALRLSWADSWRENVLEHSAHSSSELTAV